MQQAHMVVYNELGSTTDSVLVLQLIIIYVINTTVHFYTTCISAFLLVSLTAVMGEGHC